MQSLLDRLGTQNFDPRISRRNLSYFCAAARLGNFTQAAKGCGVAQPSLSRGIVLLEDAIDTALFDRTGRSVQLTAKGRELLPQVELYLNQSLDFIEHLSARRPGVATEVKVAAISSLTSDLLPILINRFEATNERTSVTLLDGINPEIVHAVDVGDVDLGIIMTREDPARFRTQELFRDQYCLVVNAAHRFHSRDTVRWEELGREEIVTFEKSSNTFETIAGVFRALGLFFEPAASVRFRNTLMGLVQHRGLVAIMPKLTVQEGSEKGTRAIPLVDPIVQRSYYLVDRKDRFKKDETKALEAFLRFELMAMEKIQSETALQDGARSE